MAAAAGDRKYICWNCGSSEHGLSGCDKEVRPENKTFWRKQFRRRDAQENERHRRRYGKFLVARSKVWEEQDKAAEEGGQGAGQKKRRRPVEVPPTKDPIFWQRHIRFTEEQREKAKNPVQVNLQHAEVEEPRGEIPQDISVDEPAAAASSTASVPLNGKSSGSRRRGGHGSLKPENGSDTDSDSDGWSMDSDLEDSVAMGKLEDPTEACNVQ